MCKTTCDSCGEQIQFNTLNEFCITGSLRLHNDDKSLLPIRVEAKIISFDFNTTGLDFCGKCKATAIKEAISKYV